MKAQNHKKMPIFNLVFSIFFYLGAALFVIIGLLFMIKGYYDYGLLSYIFSLLLLDRGEKLNDTK